MPKCQEPKRHSVNREKGRVEAAVVAVVGRVQFPGVASRCSRSDIANLLANFTNTSTSTRTTATTASATSRDIFAVSVQGLGRHGLSLLSRTSEPQSRETKRTPVSATPAAGRDDVSMPPGVSGPGNRSGTAAADSRDPPASPSSAVDSIFLPKRASAAFTAAQRIASWSPSTRDTPGVAPAFAAATARTTDTATINTERDAATEHKARQSIFRRLSPSLAARVKLLDGASSKSDTASSARSQSKSPVGKIPASQLQELERQNVDLSIRVQRRGRAWSGGLSAPHREQDSGRTHSQTGPVEPEANDQAERDAGAATATAATAAVPLLVPVPVVEHRILPTVEEKDASTDTDIHLSTMGTAGMSHGATIDAADSDIPPPPPPKDTPPLGHSSTGSNASESYFNPLGLDRPDSIYSFSRASFSNQLSQLTSISLPQPAALEESIASISSAPAAVRALSGAAGQIQKWTNKASEVLGGLEAEDDVEWAAAGGREGLDDVDKAVSKFECLINVYVKAIEEVQVREDIADVGSESLNNIVTQMEQTIQNWGKVGALLHGVKEQVELAMEWEELWNAVLGDVGLEIDNLSRMIFEMEEKRHKSVMVMEMDNEPTTGLDINELETIVEETPSNIPTNPRLNFASFMSSGTQTPGTGNQQDESSLLALFARMQPLRASLDFLPMRLSMFQSRAKDIFPSACEELEDRRLRLEQGYKKLETDSEALRRELAEDRWVIVFRNAGKQAHKMCESVERSVFKLREAIEGGIQHNNPTALAKRAENFEAKKVHYGSAIERVLSIIQKGINDRLTVNGEIIRLLADLTARFDALQASVHAMDALLDELNGRQLRDSVSSILTLDSPAGRSIGTPGSSPASSIIMSNGNTNGSTANINNHTNTMIQDTSRQSSVAGGGSTASRGTAAKLKRHSALPGPTSTGIGHTPRKPSIPRAVSTPKITTTNHSERPASRTGLVDPLTALTYSNYRDLFIPAPGRHQRSRGVMDRGSLEPGTSHAHGTAPSPSPSPSPRPSMFDPPPYSKLRKQAAAAASSASFTTTTATARPASRLMPPTPTRMAKTPVPSLPTPAPVSKLAASPKPALATAPRSRQSYAGVPSSRTSFMPTNDGPGAKKSAGPPPAVARPGTSLGHSSRRSSMLPLPRIGVAGRSGRESATGTRKDERPPWR
ncbi:hypothetical protein TEQG_02520 [Trichophyton equinum CBS 127.97]|uniref:Karyogamy protein n=1 Tax=Trichophyton equinum (strain ATCC MYA-4606 / CBS 127.97) TaxID=559882 RepID=F2PNM1_TRIEC|nr:hypothetical protein TEQG_02520 [Trichophyton equinum CBS 127.97]